MIKEARSDAHTLTKNSWSPDSTIWSQSTKSDELDVKHVTLKAKVDQYAGDKPHGDIKRRCEEGGEDHDKDVVFRFQIEGHAPQFRCG